MIIGIDISMLVYVGSGVASYTDNLVTSLLRYHPEHEYRLFYSSFRRPKNFDYLVKYKKMGAKVFSYRFPPNFLKWIWNDNFFLPIEFLIGKVDCFHSSDFLRPPLFKNTKSITTIHDLTWKIFPGYHTEEIIKAHEKKIIRTIKNNDIIVVDSNNTKKDLLNLYPNIKNSINILYLGIDERFIKLKDRYKAENVLKKYKVNIDDKYFLYVGAIEPRKNVDLCIKLFDALIKEKKFNNYKFLLVGRAGWKNEEIFNLVEKLNLKNRINFVGFVEDDDLVYFYNFAELTMYLSEYEGFGLPPLESLNCGTPVLCLNNSSVKEIINKKYLCDRKDIDYLSKKVKKILSDRQLVTKEYSWKKYSDNFIKLIT